MAITNIRELLGKGENGGSDDKGVLRAEEWNYLVQEVINTQAASEGSIKGLYLNGVEYTSINDKGLLEVETSDDVYKLTINMIKAPAAVIAKGSPCEISFSINHKYMQGEDPNGEPAGFGCTAEIYCNGEVVHTVNNIFDKNYNSNNVLKEVTFDLSSIGDRLSTTESGNLVYIKVSNGMGQVTPSQTYNIRVINMSINVSYVNGPVFTADNLPNITARIMGNTSALLYATIDGRDFISGIATAGAPYQFEPTDFIGFNTHGVHELKIWAALPDAADIKVEAAPYKYIYGDSSNSTPVIMSTINNGSKFTQYDNLNVNYVAYFAGANGDQQVVVSITNENGKTIIETDPQNITFANGSGTGSSVISLFPEDAKDTIVGNMNLNIKLGNYTDTTSIIIEKSATTLSEVPGYDIYLSSSNRSNSASNRAEWISTGRTQAQMIFDPTMEFNEAGSGWNLDEDKNVAMHLRRGKRMELDFKPFTENPVYNSGNNQGKGTGKTISIEFATRNCLSQDAPVISCMDPESGIGFEILANKATLYSNNNKVSANFKEDERIKLDIVIEGGVIDDDPNNPNLYKYDTVVGSSGTPFKGSDFEFLMIIFIDGVYQKLALIPANTTFTQKTPQNIVFGSDDCDLDVYNIRVYNYALNIDQVVKNYAFDTPKPEDKIAIALRNNIFNNPENNRPDIDIQKLREARPDLPFFYVQLDPKHKELPKDKDNWLKFTKTSWVNPNSTDNKDDGNVSWETSDGVLKNQGTSSMTYPWPWRNFDFKLNKKADGSKGTFEVPKLGGVSIKKWYQYDGMPGGIAKITLKKDYASSEMCNNAICSELFTDMALGVADKFPGVLSPAMAQETKPIKSRLTFIATPCFAFNTLNDGSGKDDPMGMMNLIPNKNECEYLGFTKNQFEDGESAPRAQSWEVCENHINWDFKIDTTFAEQDNIGAEIVDGKIGYYEEQKIPILDEKGEPVKDENGDIIYETDALGNLIYKKVYVSNYKNGIADNYEARYPKDSTIWDDTDFGYVKKNTDTISQSEFDQLYNEQVDLINFHNWLVDTNRYCATGKPLSEIMDSYEDWNYNESTGKPIYEFDTADYRLKKFEKEAPQRMLIDQWVLYYIWREQFWMFDSGSKNLQLYTMDGEQWGCMVRDADTALGIDNKGVERFPAHLEDIDFYTEVDGEMIFNYGGATGKYSVNDINGTQVLNGQFGSVWLNIRDAFGDKIAEMYRTLVTNADVTYFNSSAAIQRFDDHQANWCESLYNFGMRQYFGGAPFSDQIKSGNGDKKNARKSWLEKGFYYRNSKYENLGDVFNFRGNTYPTNDTKGSSVNVKTYIPMYLSTGGSSSGATNAKNKFRVVYPAVGADIPIGTSGLNVPGPGVDQNAYLYGSSMITDLGDLARHIKMRYITFDLIGMPKLRTFRLGDHTGKYTEIDQNTGKTVPFYNDILTSLNCNSLTSLSLLDITRHSKLSTFQFNKCLQLEEFYASGTDSITNLDFPQTTTLKKVHIGKGLKSLSMKDLSGIQSFEFDGLKNIEILDIRNCGPHMAEKTYKMVENCIDSLEVSHKSGIYTTVCTLHGINWKNATQNLIARLVDIGADLIGDAASRTANQGDINLISLSYDNKIKFMSHWKKKYGIDIDDPDNSIMHITYPEVDIEGITMPTKIYKYELGEHQLSFNPHVNGNNFTKMEWTLSSNASAYAKIDSETGILTITNVGTEEEAPYATATLKVYCNDGNIYEGSTEIHFYQRSCRLGDYVFHDGDYNDELIAGKTPIGVCFYIDPKKPENRLMVALKDIQTRSSYWGLMNSEWNNDGGIKDVTLVDDPTYDCYNINGQIDDIRTRGVSFDTSDMSIPDNYPITKEVYKAGFETDGYFTKFSPSVMYGDLGWLPAYTRVSVDGVTYAKNEAMPIGLYRTLSIIAHRNKILTSFRFEGAGDGDWEIPTANPEFNMTEKDVLDRILNGMDLSYGGDMKFTYYYPAASYCYAYTPTADPNLDDRFKEHNWFLPAIGDVVRIMYHQDKTEGEDAIFNKAFNDGKMDRLGSTWSSTEYNQRSASYCPISGRVPEYGYMKANSNAVRPICKF